MCFIFYICKKVTFLFTQTKYPYLTLCYQGWICRISFELQESNFLAAYLFLYTEGLFHVIN
ncbi:hypothetical protein DQG23_03145 [Paenibacillus contaminans]|uniref:Uncharacterized protein n=1 Tax=Paenibacillus contaminans TaxID=450362 RepID=A0A329MV61_9BACL|nr:hypothetical protein DQG23_03145 [Paenibacillus contaminans]